MHTFQNIATNWRSHQVPKGLSSQPRSVDAALCRRVATISRVSVPAVGFQLAGLAAAAVLHYLRGHDLVHLSHGGEAMYNEEDRSSREKEAVNQWAFVDELDAGVAGSSPEGHAGPTSGWGEERIEGESDRRGRGARQRVDQACLTRQSLRCSRLFVGKRCHPSILVHLSTTPTIESWR